MHLILNINRIIFCLSLLGIISFSACTKKIYFTKELKKRIEHSGQDISKVQFYSSRDITLRLNDPSSEIKIDAGKIKINDQRKISEVFIKKYTKGMCVASYDDQLDIAFEKGEYRYLGFIEEDCTKSNTKWILKTPVGDKTYSTTHYDGAEYYITPESENAKLLVKNKQVEKLIKKRRVLRGVKVR